MGLWSGNANISPPTANSSGGLHNVGYNGKANDRSAILSLVGSATPLNTVNGYNKEDLNMDGKVSYNGLANDRSVILSNIGSSTPNNIILQHFQ